MAELTDPRAAGFSAADFRDNIRFAMRMGAPAEALQATFLWSPVRTYAVQDPAGNPYNWTEAPATDQEHDPVTLDVVAVEFAPAVRPGEGEDVGHFDETRGTITILDEDYEQVKTANKVKFANRTYLLRTPLPFGLFDVTVWQIPIVEGDER